MEVNFNRKNISAGNFLNVFVDQKLVYMLRSKGWFIWNSKNFIIDTNNNIVFELKKHWFHPLYSISKKNHKQGIFRPVNRWKNQYQLVIEGKKFEIVGHTGHKVSIFQEEEQIGWFDKKSISWFNGINYSMTCNDDVDTSFMALIVLVWNDIKESGSSGGSTVTFDFGNFGPEAIKFNEGWRPKKSNRLLQ